MKTLAFLLAACLLLVGTAYAQKVEPLEQTVDMGNPNRFDCVTDGYDHYTSNPGGSVPDNDPTGTVFGPVPTVDTGVIMDVILALDIDHTWVGDLRIFLLYDVECDYSVDAEGQVLCRPGLDGCPPDLCCGCSGDFGGWYSFDDEAVVSVEDICPSVFSAGCYGPDYDSVGLDVFDGMPSGGCFWLYVADGAGGDVGMVHAWEFHVLTDGAPPVEAALDIKPTSCPNPLNVKSRGVLPAAILGTEDFDVTQIDPASIMLACVVSPLRWNYSDVATPVGADPEPCECTEEGPDGYLDLTLKFDTQEVVAAIGVHEDGDEVTVFVHGSLLDGTPVSFHDCVWIIDKTREATRTALGAPDVGAVLKESTEPATWGTIKALYR